jgi:hypothetical protein
LTSALAWYPDQTAMIRVSPPLTPRTLPLDETEATRSLALCHVTLPGDPIKAGLPE